MTRSIFRLGWNGELHNPFTGSPVSLRRGAGLSYISCLFVCFKGSQAFPINVIFTFFVNKRHLLFFHGGLGGTIKKYGDFHLHISKILESMKKDPLKLSNQKPFHRNKLVILASVLRNIFGFIGLVEGLYFGTRLGLDKNSRLKYWPYPKHNGEQN